MSRDWITELSRYLRNDRGSGPLAVIVADEALALNATLDHLARVGFATIVVIGPKDLPIGARAAGVTHVAAAVNGADSLSAAATAAARSCKPGRWIYCGYGGEFPFFPHCDTRSVSEMLAFHAEERREAMVAHAVDLYPADLAQDPAGIDLRQAHLDAAGYFLRQREDPDRDWAPMDRQYDVFGGLRWRFEDFVPQEQRRIDRVAFFRAAPGRALSSDFLLNDPELNTRSCPWHHNLTAAIPSFRAARALMANPGSRAEISSFLWERSVPFDWTPEQLLNLGLMEPGQWF